MIIQMAPLEGITTYIYRRAYQKYFGDVDLYYVPFISLSGEKVFNHKEKAELSAENNRGVKVVPQVITNSAADVLGVQEKFRAMGFDEMNINLGCPSGTVTPKGRGSGMLRDPMKLDMFLTEVFEKTTMKVSLKTRIGYDSPEEWEDLIKIYNKYPASQLIVHPRVRADFYKNTPRLEAFRYAVENSKSTLCYNGDIYTVQDYLYLKKNFPQLDSVMLGRGVLTNPFLVEQIRAVEKRAGFAELAGEACGVSERMIEVHEEHAKIAGLSDMPEEYAGVVSPGIAGGKLYRVGVSEVERLELFHDEIFASYKEILSGDRNLLFKMKEFWHYMVNIFPDAKKHDKKIKKMNNCAEYVCYVKELFRGVRNMVN